MIPPRRAQQSPRKNPKPPDFRSYHPSSSPAYARALKRENNAQTVMTGYSDSTTDSGYLAACWRMHQAQIAMHDVANAHGVALTFFHGRGGSLGRGGGPTAATIRSLPAQPFMAASA
ncbi:MAG: phosphoenolpyruvate carboxylase [Phycisphaeraceae bacterium]|nr:phosphoenolpyruvate carboxylase [Phycisphaeraceae bacterium]